MGISPTFCQKETNAPIIAGFFIEVMAWPLFRMCPVGVCKGRDEGDVQFVAFLTQSCLTSLMYLRNLQNPSAKKEGRDVMSSCFHGVKFDAKKYALTVIPRSISLANICKETVMGKWMFRCFGNASSLQKICSYGDTMQYITDKYL